MWTDGSENLQTNFADNSELEGGQCCVKTGARGWRGAACQSLLYGVCQHEVSLSSLLASPSYSVTPLHRGLRLSWSCGQCQGWQPSHFSITICLARRLEEPHQPAGDEDCQAWQLEEEVELATLATEIRSIMSSSLLQSGALLLRGLKVVFKYSPESLKIL